MRLAPLARKFSALALVLAAAAFCATAVEAEHLSQNAIPSNYTLTLTPDLKAATFTGKETIELTLVEPTNTITLNALEITFKSVTATVAARR